MPKKAKSRPGGRSLRIRGAVFAALEELLLRSPGDLPSMALIAARAGVNATSLYRRWRDVRQLAGEVAVERLMRDNPLADTGSLRGDLIAWASAAAASLGSRRNVLLLRILTATPPPKRIRSLEELPIGPRVQQLEAMLARARQRGETTPSMLEVLELLLAPIYLRALFVGPIDDESDVPRLVDRALSLKAG